MRSGHGGAAESTIITIVTGIHSGANVCSWSSDVWFGPIASIDCDRTATAEESNNICTIDQCPNRVHGVINRRRIKDRGATLATVISGPNYHHYSGSSLSFN